MIRKAADENEFKDSSTASYGRRLAGYLTYLVLFTTAMLVPIATLPDTTFAAYLTGIQLVIVALSIMPAASNFKFVTSLFPTAIGATTSMFLFPMVARGIYGVEAIPLSDTTSIPSMIAALIYPMSAYVVISLKTDKWFKIKRNSDE
jgi:tellurite resistance protein TehA-like permease